MREERERGGGKKREIECMRRGEKDEIVIHYCFGVILTSF